MGATLVGIPTMILLVSILGAFAFDDVVDIYFIAASTLAALLVAFGSCVGCRWALRRRGSPAANRTAAILGVVLVSLFIVGLVSSPTELQSSLFPYLSVAAVPSPLLAHFLAIRSNSDADR